MRLVYLYLHLDDLYGKSVGKYTVRSLQSVQKYKQCIDVFIRMARCLIIFVPS